MYCKYCGNKLDNNATFCSTCGKRVADNVEFFEEQPIESPQQKELKSELGSKILGFGIAGIVLTFISLIVFLVFLELVFFLETDEALVFLFFVILSPILGLIFSSISRKTATTFKDSFGETEGKATVGKNIALPALIINIIILSICFLIFNILIIA